MSKVYISSDIPLDSIVPHLRDLIEQVEIQQRTFTSNDMSSSDRVLRKVHHMLRSNILEIEVKKDAIVTLTVAINELLAEIDNKENK